MREHSQATWSARANGNQWLWRHPLWCHTQGTQSIQAFRDGKGQSDHRPTELWKPVEDQGLWEIQGSVQREDLKFFSWWKIFTTLKELTTLFHTSFKIHEINYVRKDQQCNVFKNYSIGVGHFYILSVFNSFVKCLNEERNKEEAKKLILHIV